jgi:WS/DGAT/MGAT family acyltransferase
MWLLPGLPDRRVGLYLKLHHAVADGLAGIALIGAFLDVDPDAPLTVPPPWAPRPLPSEGDLRADARRRRCAAAGEVVSQARHPVASVRRTRSSAAALWSISRSRAPRTSLNRPIGDRRQVSVLRLDLEAARGVAHRHHATINDLVLTLTAEGLRALLRHRGESPEGVVLRAVVPVSLHDEDPGAASGNRDGSMLVPLPVRSCTPVQRLESVAGATQLAKRSVFVPPAGVLARTAFAQRATWRRFDQQRWTTTYVADLPGPSVPLHLAGARLRDVFPMVPITGNITVGTGALSYAGALAVAFVADVDTCSDLDVFVDAVAAAVEELGLDPAVSDGG